MGDFGLTGYLVLAGLHGGHRVAWALLHAQQKTWRAIFLPSDPPPVGGGHLRIGV